MTQGQFRGVAGINGGLLLGGLSLIGDRVNGKIYSMNMDTFTDNGDLITRVRRTQIINKERVYVLHTKVEVNFQTGVGLDVGAAVDGYDPEATLKWSDDGGNTWTSGISLSMGKYQDYLKRVIWRRLGKSRNRIYELTITSPVKVIITGAYADIKDCRS